MTALRILCLVFLILFLATLGHDLYNTYKDGNYDQPVKFTEFGWLWVTYIPDTLDALRSTIRPEVWKEWIVPVLKTKSVIVTGAPLATFLAIILLVRGCSLLKTGGRTARNQALRDPFAPQKSGRGFKYKRK